ncbi:hypothetical protein [Magnetofaba australis]|uniref:Uncharacterized protein n=1 Tax=Magnetofaba australis IT-1 TaxID=1434232 RepID=A0A1Y2K3J3_9PROT|nr:hypothetical protein [Magnetofaba australis]OSM01595.1 hypothetical protein MAIT1_01598 [Magnetofaba australis IT-1]
MSDDAQLPSVAHPAPLAIADYSPQAIRRAVIRNAAQSPWTLYPLVIGILGGVAGALFSLAEGWIACGLGVVGGLSYWGVQISVRHNANAHHYLAALHEQRRAHRLEAPKRLRQTLTELNYLAGVEQLDKLDAKFSSLKQVLESKFSPQEITYSRYLGMAEQVHLAALDRLEDVASVLLSVRSIDPAYIQRRLDELGYSEGQEPPAEGDVAALLARMALLHKSQETALEISRVNEQAMTALDLTAVKLANIRTRQGRAAIDMETAMTELAALAERSHLYQVHDRTIS